MMSYVNKHDSRVNDMTHFPQPLINMQIRLIDPVNMQIRLIDLIIN
jgi:hypothetical protein